MIKSAIYGFAVGDALGVPYEFQKRGMFECVGMRGWGTWCQPAGTWSDDTSMVLATCASLRENKGQVNYRDLMHKFTSWLLLNEYSCNGTTFDVGNTTREAIHHYLNDHNPITCGQRDYFDNGNGALMRMLPLAFIDCEDYEILGAAMLTHAHEISLNVCLDYVKLTKKLIKTRNIRETLGECEYEWQRKRDNVSSSGFVVDTFEAAKWCLVNSKSYKDCVLKAVNLGGDTDTIAAIAGGWAGIVYGYRNIPFSWRRKLRNKKLINSCIKGAEKWKSKK